MVKTMVVDAEADGLLDDATVVHCIVCKDYDTGEVFKFVQGECYEEFKEFSQGVDTWIGHNIISYDIPLFNKLLGIDIKLSHLRDTMVLSRLFGSDRVTPKGAKSAHSLQAWGIRLGRGKGDHTDFTTYSPEMLTYCVNDVEVTYLTYCALMIEGNGYSEQSIKLEYQTEYLLSKMQRKGFYLDQAKALKLYQDCKTEADDIEEDILHDFLPKAKEIRVITPRYNKDGRMSVVGLKWLNSWRIPTVGGEFTRIEWVPFNLGSPKQKLDRLRGHWEPYERTKGYRKIQQQLRDGEITKEEHALKEQYTWTVSDKNLETIHSDAPQSLKLLARWAMVTSRYKMVEGWLDNVKEDGRVHGGCIGVGAITHRMAHSNPNMANIPSIHSPYGKDSRECWSASTKDNVIVGVDASGIQLRILAHYMDDPEYTHQVLEGDIHTYNLKALGIPKGKLIDGKYEARDKAKTFIYAWLLGATTPLISKILGVDMGAAKNAEKNFLDSLPQLDYLKNKRCVADAEKGYMTAIDGRRVPIKSAHYALSAYLQSGETIVMRTAMIFAYKMMKKKGIEFPLVGLIHDEFQNECNKDVASQVEECYIKGIRQAGDYYKLKCPMDGEGKTGLSWAQTH